jgi:hypothetical protein
MIYSTEPTITLSMIIDAGILSPGIKVYSVMNKQITGILNSDGSITLKIKDEIKNFPFPSGAARAIENRSLNGWIYWQVLDSGEYRDLGFFREIFSKRNK